MEKVKLGFMEAISPPLVNAPDSLGRPLRRKDIANACVKHLKKMGFEVMNYDKEGPVDTAGKAWNAMKEFVYHDVDAVVFFCSSWIWITHYMQAFRKGNLPVIIWAPAEPYGWTLNSLAVASGAMRTWKIPFKQVYGLPGEEEVDKRILTFAKAAGVKSRLERSRFGFFGGTSMGISGGFADFIEWAKKFGIFMEHTSEILIVHEAEKFDKKEVAKVYKRLKRDLGEVPELDPQMERSIRHYLGMKKIIKENGYDFCALKCTFDASKCYISACLTQGLLASEGFVSTCEGDCYAALTEWIFRLLTDEQFFMADVQHVKMDKGIVVLVDDGAASPLLAKDKKCVRLTPQWTGEAEAGGVSWSVIAKPGTVTLARLTKTGDRHVMQIAGGEAIEVDRKNLSKMCDCGQPNWPHAFVKLKGDPRKFIEALNVEYVHMVYGNLEEELKEVCGLLDIDVVIT